MSLELGEIPRRVSFAYETVSDVRAGLERSFTFFNHRRPHTVLTGRTADYAYKTARRHGRAPVYVLNAACAASNRPTTAAERAQGLGNATTQTARSRCA